MDAISLAEKADDLYQNGKFDEALLFYNRAIETDAKNATLWNRRGLALCRLGRHEEAIVSFDTALRIDPHYIDARHAWAWNSKGLALMALGRDAEADAAFARGAEIMQNEDGG